MGGWAEWRWPGGLSVRAQTAGGYYAKTRAMKAQETKAQLSLSRGVRPEAPGAASEATSAANSIRWRLAAREWEMA
ncbi:hypothetical protein AG1IA_01170 [Rhizoctonia solani AG-1 IA]|uniref:Uncharacterized protein n=1 Tax=Thanatephorus cucumeris (strain AG1-IA) TaxID=983506 RepID=L8X838_THACA|nr:hypothetical protein AG1IA_01170 [Rhizoctonia solani AG-1 IA]